MAWNCFSASIRCCSNPMEVTGSSLDSIIPSGKVSNEYWTKEYCARNNAFGLSIMYLYQYYVSI